MLTARLREEAEATGINALIAEVYDGKGKPAMRLQARFAVAEVQVAIGLNAAACAGSSPRAQAIGQPRRLRDGEPPTASSPRGAASPATP